MSERRMRPKDIAAQVTFRNGARLTMREAQFLDLIMDVVAYTVEQVRKELSAIKYRGVWRAGIAYARGDFCTHEGSMWHADRDQPDKPGNPKSGWTLAIKRGKDAKA